MNGERERLSECHGAGISGCVKKVVISTAVLFPLWFTAVFFVGAHLWLASEASGQKQQICQTLADEVGITIHYSAYEEAGCPDIAH
jgi:hypothetical protein